MCQNEGALNNETCMCDCADGFSGPNCESEYIVRRGQSPGCKMPREEAKSMGFAVDIFYPLFERVRALEHIPCCTIVPVSLYIYALVSACSRVCQNEGTQNDETCMCDCAGGYSGDNCESKFICNIYSTVWRSWPRSYIYRGYRLTYRIKCNIY